MSYYLPVFRPQRNDPVETHATHENNNCLMASGAMALDYHTLGRLRVWGGDLRHRQTDQIKGTDLGDLATAWKSYGETLDIRTGKGWAGVLAALAEGRCVLLAGDSGNLDGSCAEVQDVEHGIIVHPDRDAAGRYRYGDPWCSPPGWEWATADALKRYAAPLGLQFAVTAAQEVLMAVVVLTPLVPARTFRVAAGVTVRGFRPDSSTPVKSAQFASAKADATAVISQSPSTLVPHGSFVRAWDGPLAGLYIPASEVTLDPAPPTADCTAAVRQGWNDARQAAANAAGAAILAAVPMK